MIKEELKNLINKAIIKEFSGFDIAGISLELPKEKAHGDYFTNVAFVLAKTAKKNPQEIALALKSSLEKELLIKKIEVVGGFINFFS
jgi:arginyl-tRNA synthetase